MPFDLFIQIAPGYTCTNTPSTRVYCPTDLAQSASSAEAWLGAPGLSCRGGAGDRGEGSSFILCLVLLNPEAVQKVPTHIPGEQGSGGYAPII